MTRIDLALVNGRIRTLDPSRPTATALAVADGAIVHVGDEAEIREECDASTQVIDLRKNDCFYIFTDGYADQFGGSNNKKFMYRKLQEKLISIAGRGMSDQRDELQSTFAEWRGKNDQVDDVLIIGLRF